MACGLRGRDGGRAGDNDVTRGWRGRERTCTSYRLVQVHCRVVSARMRSVAGMARTLGNELAGMVSTGRIQRQRRQRRPSIQQTCTSYRLVQVRCRCSGRDGRQRRRRCIHRLLARGRNEEKDNGTDRKTAKSLRAGPKPVHRHLGVTILLPFHNDDDDLCTGRYPMQSKSRRLCSLVSIVARRPTLRSSSLYWPIASAQARACATSKSWT